MKREELKIYCSAELYDRVTRTFEYGDCYLKDKADSVMDAMEKQIRTLENDKEEMYEVNLVLQARIKELEAENEQLKKDLEQTEANNELQGKSLVAHSELITKFRKENERLKGEVKRLEDNEEFLANEEVKILDERDGLRKENAKLRYALALLRWEHAHNMETMIDQLYTERPSSWSFYRKSKVYWFNKWQELKKKLMEGLNG